MKKYIMFVVMIIMLTGCDNKMLNTPTKKVEMFFSNYQSLDNKVLDDLNKATLDDLSLDDDQRKEYIDIMKRHYQALQYEIKDEIVDGDSAFVTVEIEVYDYSKILEEAIKYKNENEDEFIDDEGNFSEKLYNDYRIELIKNNNDKVKYSLEITLSKVDGEWVIDDLSKDAEDKINGIYSY